MTRRLHWLSQPLAMGVEALAWRTESRAVWTWTRWSAWTLRGLYRCARCDDRANYGELDTRLRCQVCGGQSWWDRR